jgi:hypothetical protein
MLHSLLPRLVGAALIAVVMLLIAGGRSVRTWLGRPVPGGSWVEEANRESGGTLPGYGLYRGYVTVAGWFWLIAFTVIMGAFGIYFLATGYWL